MTVIADLLPLFLLIIWFAVCRSAPRSHGGRLHIYVQRGFYPFFPGKCALEVSFCKYIPLRVPFFRGLKVVRSKPFCIFYCWWHWWDLRVFVWRDGKAWWMDELLLVVILLSKWAFVRQPLSWDCLSSA